MSIILIKHLEKKSLIVDVDKRNLLRLLNKFKKNSSKLVKDGLLQAFNSTHTILPVQALDAVELLVTGPKRYIKSQKQLDILNKADVFYVEVRSKTVKAWSWGESEKTILLSHGWAASGIQLYKFIEPLVEAGYKVITFDCVGHGESQGRRSNFLFFYETIRILEGIIGPFHGVIAHSLGASASFSYFSKKGEHKTKLFLIAPGFDLLTIFYESALAIGLSGKIIDQVIGRVEGRFKMPLKDYAPINLIDESKSEILFIHDNQDMSVPLKNNISVYEQVSNSELYRTEGLGHIRILKSIDVIAKAIKFFES
jgi:pimeloyl-ACP methyl ester carboxylesterase